MNSFFTPRAKRALLVLAVLFCLLQPLVFAQMTGSVMGTVADVTGAVIPDAKVTLKNVQTGEIRATVSNGVGAFAFASVTPGTKFVVFISVPGFKTWESQPFALRPSDRYDFSDIRMVIGATQQEVFVEASAETAKITESGERSDVITSKQIQTLSVIGRDAGELVKILPGFVMDPGDNQLNNVPNRKEIVGNGGGAGAYNGNGTKSATSILLDGANITNIGGNSGSVSDVNLDQVSEIKVSTSAYSAENNKGPIVINAVGKSGSSAFHGSAYLHARNGVLNSNDWIANNTGVAKPDSSFFYPGGTIGGPIIIPHTNFNRNRDKLFFFLGFEYYKQRYPNDLNPLLQMWVPTESERAGKFDAASLDQELCSNPYNAGQLMCQTQNYLPNGTVVNPADITPYIVPGGQAFMKLFPHANRIPANDSSIGYNYVSQVMQDQNGQTWHGRIDYNVNERNKLFFSFNRQTQAKSWPYMIDWYPSQSMQYPGDVAQKDKFETAALNFTRVFSTTLTNEASFGVSYAYSPMTMNNPDAVDRTKLGYANASGQVYHGLFRTGEKQMPALLDWSQFGYPQSFMPGGFTSGAMHSRVIVPNVTDTLSWVKGKHLLKTGIYWESAARNALADWNFYPQGQIQFAPWTYMWNNNVGPANGWGGCQAGNGYSAHNIGNCFNPVAQILMGMPDQYSESNMMPDTNVGYSTFAGFATDTWKINRRLTLDFGARFEHLSPWRDRNGRGMATFDPALYAQQCPTARVYNSTVGCTVPSPGLTWHSLSSNVSNSVVNPAAVFISPRFGLAWDIFGTGKTVLRGGWGAYRNQEEYNPFSNAAASALGYKTVNATMTAMTDGPSPYNLMTFDSIDAQGPGSSPIVADSDIYALSPNDKMSPVYYNYNLTISQRLPWKSLMEIAYVGSNSEHLNSGKAEFSDLNMIPYGTLWQADISPMVANAKNDISAFGDAENDMFRPYPFYRHIYVLSHKLYSNYNSLQASWNKQSGRFQYGANYTFSKTLAVAQPYTTWLPDPKNLRNDYNPAPFDRTHVFNVHYLIDVGDHVRGNKVLGGLANGWQISGITTIQSGVPMASLVGGSFGLNGPIDWTVLPFQNQSDQSAGQGGQPSHTQQCITATGSPYCTQSISSNVWLGSPDYYLMPQILCDPRSGLSGGRIMNSQCFAIPDPTTLSNGPYRQPYVHLPYYFYSDLSLLKNFRMGESRNLQFRFAAFNFLNHPLRSFNKNNSDNENLYTSTNRTARVGVPLVPSMLSSGDKFGVPYIKYGNRIFEMSVKYEF